MNTVNKMNNRKLLIKVILGILLATMLAGSVGAETIKFNYDESLSWLIWPSSPEISLPGVVNITPYDFSRGSLNSVTINGRLWLTVSMSLRPELDEIGFGAAVMLAQVPEMGSPEVSVFTTGYMTPPYEQYFINTDDTYLEEKTIYTDFGRFVGADPFEISWLLYGVSPNNPMNLYGGVSLSIEYNVPEPSLMILLGISVLSLAGLKRWWKE